MTVKQFVAFSKGQVIFKEHETGDKAYLVMSGVLRVYRESSGRIYELNRLGPGEVVGEMALITETPRSATVEALEDSELMVLDKATMTAMLKKTPDPIQSLLKLLSTRLRGATMRANERNFANPLIAIARILDTQNSIQVNLRVNKSGRREDDKLGVSISLSRFKKDVLKLLTLSEPEFDSIISLLVEWDLIDLATINRQTYITVLDSMNFLQSVRTKCDGLGENTPFTINESTFADVYETSRITKATPEVLLEKVFSGDISTTGTLLHKNTVETWVMNMHRNK